MKLSTHVLDTVAGKPAANVRVSLRRGDETLTQTLTNADGRAVLLEAPTVSRGVYELVFSIGEYFQTPADPPFLGDVIIRFGISDGSANYHVPLLVSPHGYTTYRGS